ncbi:MAG: methionyl-tRNA formyltransferase [Carnobacterium sp.]|uniref:methionyl-tRNA formyltransferase n=1 Tax=Carnobacterium sp. TaxID=48221 RepID=UPI002FCA2798
MTKIVFMGTPAFSVPILEALIDEGYDIAAVVTQPDRPVGRKKVMTPTPVKEAALQHQILVLQPEKISGSEEMAKVIELQPDLIVTAAFGQFLPQKLLSAPRLGAINVHASLLPKYRGGAPVHYSLIKGEKETGVTIMYMEKKMDAGDILSQRSLEITEKDDVGTLFERLSRLGRDLLIDTLPDLIAGKVTPVKQDEEKVTYSPNIKAEEELIDWSKSAKEIDWQVRGMRPWPGAYTSLNGNRLKVWDVTPLDEDTDKEPGTIIQIEKERFMVACGERTVVQVNELQPAGKSKMTTTAFLSGVGSQLRVGEMVGDNGN